MSRVAQWGRRAVTRYTQKRTGKRDLGSWKQVVGGGSSSCRLCGCHWESGRHLVFDCLGLNLVRGWRWRDCDELDEKDLWQVVVELEGKVVVRDCVEDFFGALHWWLAGVG